MFDLSISDEYRRAAFKAIAATLFVVFALLLLADPSHAAGTNGAEFKALYDLVAGWATGYLGRVITVVFLLVGLGVGIARGSVFGVVVTLVVAVAFVMLPTIIDAIFAGSAAAG